MTAQQQFETFLRKYDPTVASEGKKCLAKLCKLVPGAIEMVYDNYNFLVVGFCRSMHPSDDRVHTSLGDSVLPAGQGAARSGEAFAGKRECGAPHSTGGRCENVG
jgi:hypothetical protein